MGISGLLPALKSIQKTKHLSEFKGQSIGVDAYVWLHKGVYSCATELATGKPTHRYVDYAMHRVRLLRHFGIEPYVVFDGGSLPAKRGTESKRKQSREENLSRGKAFLAQGRHSQARDCFVKCVDVTPQMAYQFIKALQAENVQYVVAPYEADAQLAYLERTNLISAILTEDSDLLVFGCKNVLFKLDHVAHTVCHISRNDFGSVRSTASDSSSINLHGWNDTQFRAMAILSGCDYLPSIPGIGLKTANSMLRKWKTAEAVIKSIILEGKKRVPNGYLEQFILAEKCFRFQRVYEPLEKKLVHLTDIEGEWDTIVDAYVGETLTPELATGIALGDVDPVTKLPMNDINPRFKPNAPKRLEKKSNSPRKEKGKEMVTGGILNFFGPNPVIPRESSTVPKSSLKPVSTGASSGKRRLGDVMDKDLIKRKQRNSSHTQDPVPSKFFSAVAHRESIPKRVSGGTVAGPSRVPQDNKENVCIVIDDDDSADDAGALSTLSIRANISPTQEVDLDFEDSHDMVEQEDGYMSPFSPYSGETQDFPSPSITIFTPLKKQKRKSFPAGHYRTGEYSDSDEEVIIFGGERGEDDFDADPVSSPICTIKKKRRPFSSQEPAKSTSGGLLLQTPARSLSEGNVLVASTPLRESPNHGIGAAPHTDVFGHYSFLHPVEPKPTFNGPDLQSCLGVEDEAGAHKNKLAAESRRGSRDVKIHGATESSNLFASYKGRNPSGSKPKSGSGQGSGPDSVLGSQSDPTSPLSPLPQTLPHNVNTTHATVNDKKLAVGANVSGKVQGKVVIDTEGLEDEEGNETEIDLDDDPEENVMKMQEEKLKCVVKGWRMKWALGQLQREDSSSASSSAELPNPVATVRKRNPNKKRRQSAPMALGTNRLRRTETNVTPLGKHSLANSGTNRPLPHLHLHPLARSVQPKERKGLDPLGVPKIDGICVQQPQELRNPPSLIFFSEHKSTATVVGTIEAVEPLGGKTIRTKSRYHNALGPSETMDVCSDSEQVEINPEVWAKLNKFRYR